MKVSVGYTLVQEKGLFFFSSTRLISHGRAKGSSMIYMCTNANNASSFDLFTPETPINAIDAKCNDAIYTILSYLIQHAVIVQSGY